MDGDTSTNDTVLGLASGAAGGALISDASSPEGQQLEAAVTALLQVSRCAREQACCLAHLQQGTNVAQHLPDSGAPHSSCAGLLLYKGSAHEPTKTA